MLDTPDIKHKDGVPWHEAPLPPVEHECWPQTTGWVGLHQWARCPCGAVADGSELKIWREVQAELGPSRYSRSAVEKGLWLERNSRSSSGEQPRPRTTRRPWWRRGRGT